MSCIDNLDRVRQENLINKEAFGRKNTSLILYLLEKFKLDYLLVLVKAFSVFSE